MGEETSYTGEGNANIKTHFSHRSKYHNTSFEIVCLLNVSVKLFLEQTQLAGRLRSLLKSKFFVDFVCF